jgi:hypothetical protein
LPGPTAGGLRSTGTLAALTGVWVFYQAHLQEEKEIFDRLLRLMTKTTALATV